MHWGSSFRCCNRQNLLDCHQTLYPQRNPLNKGAIKTGVRIAGVTVPISHLLNDDKDIYSTFYTNTFTDENITNARNKLSSVADELFLKTELEAQAGAKIVTPAILTLLSEFPTK